MTYKVTVLSKYNDGTSLKTEFDTTSMLMHEAHKQAQMEAMMARWHQSKSNSPEKPLFQKITLKPIRG